jgi:hypothetical protein
MRLCKVIHRPQLGAVTAFITPRACARGYKVIGRIGVVVDTYTYLKTYMDMYMYMYMYM